MVAVKTVIYADVLVAVNIYVTYFLLVGVRVLLKTNTKGIFTAISAVVGGFSSLFVLLDCNGIFINIAYRLFVGAAVTAIAFLPQSFLRFLKIYGVFFCVSFVFGGVMLLFECIFHPKGMVFINGTVYFDVSVLFIAVMSVVCYGVVLLFEKLLKKRAAQKTLYTVTVLFRGKSARFTALYDTGNALTDGIEGRPVVVVERRFLKQLFCDGEYEFFKNGDFTEVPPEALGKYIRLVAGKSVCGSSLFWAFLPEGMYISDGKSTCFTDFVTVAVTNTDFSGGEYGALLNCDIFERSKITNEIKI